MKKIIHRYRYRYWGLGVFLSLVMGGTGIAGDLPKEPGEECLVNENVNITQGFYYREYSLKQDGVVDFKTARQMYFAEYNEFWNTVVQTEEHPFFYWIDENRDGEFEHFVDQRVEGRRKTLSNIYPCRNRNL